MSEGKQEMTAERYSERNHPTRQVGDKRPRIQYFDAANGDEPMRGGGGATYGDEPANLSNKGLHASTTGRVGMNVAADERVPEGVRRIVVCADDFGMNTQIDEGIIALARMRRVSAVGCMTHAPAFSQDAPRLRELPVDVGVHLNFTEALGQPGLYMPLPQLITCAYARLLDGGRLQRQIERQLDTFEAVMGAAPDFIDGHQHVHQLPQIRTALLEVTARRYANRAPWLRCTAPGVLLGLPKNLRFKAQVIGALGARALTRAATAAGLRSNRRLLGVYDFQGGAQVYDELLALWLGNARDGDLLMCHPAARGSSDAMASQRSAEFQVLSSAGLAEWLLHNRLRIGRLGEA
jgi:predicted glycoside hydrolase/deacetylase ChbG (UPF0249 family)